VSAISHSGADFTGTDGVKAAGRPHRRTASHAAPSAEVLTKVCIFFFH
jgi:hypothetical protein